jgi:hypothetical protein
MRTAESAIDVHQHVDIVCQTLKKRLIGYSSSSEVFSTQVPPVFTTMNDNLKRCGRADLNVATHHTACLVHACSQPFANQSPSAQARVTRPIYAYAGAKCINVYVGKFQSIERHCFNPIEITKGFLLKRHVDK